MHLGRTLLSSISALTQGWRLKTENRRRSLVCVHNLAFVTEDTQLDILRMAEAIVTHAAYRSYYYQRRKVARSQVLLGQGVAETLCLGPSGA